MPQTRTRRAHTSILHHTAASVLGVTGITTLFVGIIGVFLFAVVVAEPGLRSTQLAAVVTATLVDLTNQDREQNKIDGLTVNPLLVEAAQAKANDMAKNSYFAHTSPAGLTPWYWFKQAGYNFTYAGENLAVDFTDSDTVNQAWMNSPEHRANILNSHFTDIGIATAQGIYQGQETAFVVQEFASPALSPAQASTIVLDSISPKLPTQMAYATTKAKIATTTSLSKVLGASVKATTSVQTVPAVGTSQEHEPVWAFLIASPLLLLRIVYIIFATILLLAVAIRTGLEFKRHHLRHVLVALALLILMGILLFVADHYIFAKPIIGTSASTQTTSVL
jgi:hypothetical protein